MAQAIAGGVQGFFLTVLEMYLYIYLFNFSVVPMTGLLESLLYILAIIITPVILGFLSYVEVSNAKIVFVLLEVVFFVAFLMLAPFSVFAIFVLVSLVSILISIYAGTDFAWFRILNSS